MAAVSLFFGGGFTEINILGHTLCWIYISFSAKFMMEVEIAVSNQQLFMMQYGIDVISWQWGLGCAISPAICDTLFGTFTTRQRVGEGFVVLVGFYTSAVIGGFRCVTTRSISGTLRDAYSGLGLG